MDAGKQPMIIDAHQHFWRIGHNDCQWPTPDLAIYRDYLPEDLAPLAAATGVGGTVLVQSQASDADTDFLLDIADQTELVQAVVGWVNLASPIAAARITALAAHPKMRGLRPMLQALPEDSWILSAALEPALGAMKAAGLSLDALVFPRHLPYLRIFAKRHPDLPLVLDHGAKPAIGGPDFERWKDGIAAMAELPQVYCKLSGLLTEAADEAAAEQLAAYVQHLYRSFGSSRLMWGSDWPVLALAPAHNNYGDWFRLASRLLPLENEREFEDVFGNTARRFYRF